MAVEILTALGRANLAAALAILLILALTSFVMGLIGGILQPIFAGFPVTLMPPAAFLQRPLRWLKAVSDWRATTSGGPDFALLLGWRCMVTVGSSACVHARYAPTVAPLGQ